MKIDCIIGIRPRKQWGYRGLATQPQCNGNKDAERYKRDTGFSQLLQRDLHADCLFGKIERSPGRRNGWGCRGKYG